MFEQVERRGWWRPERRRGGGWLGTDQEYDDFEIKLEFRLGKDGNSGIF